MLQSDTSALQQRIAELEARLREVEAEREATLERLRRDSGARSRRFSRGPGDMRLEAVDGATLKRREPVLNGAFLQPARIERAFRVLASTNQIIIRAVNEGDLLQEICQAMVTLGGFRLAWIGFAEHDEAKRVRVATCAGEASGYAESLQVSWSQDLPLGNGPTGRTIRTGKSVIARFDLESTFEPWRELATRYGISSSASFPLWLDDGTVGTFSLYSADDDAFDEHEESLWAELAVNLAFGLDVLRGRAKREEAESDRNRSLADLERQRDFTSRIVDHVPVGVSYMDRDLVFQWTNTRYLQAVQIPADRLLGRSVFEVFGPETEDQIGPMLRGVVETGVPYSVTSFPFTYLLDGQDLKSYWDFTYQPVFGPHGRVEGILIFCSEVSDRVGVEQLQRERIEHLHQLDGLKVNFLNAASHELRTPLSSIQGFAEFLEDGIGGPLSAEQAGFVTEIQRGAERLRRIVDDMLDFARLEAGSFRLSLQETDLREVVARATVSLQPQAVAAQTTITAAVPDEQLPARVDPARVEQVLLNLIGNAIKFTPAGGQITIEAERRAGQIHLAVRDTGIGISAQHQSRIFEKFFQVDPSTTRAYGGAGLGLAISRALVEAHHGHLHVESMPGEGSTFWLTLPTE